MYRKIDMFDNTTLHLVYHFRWLFIRLLKLKTVYIIYNIQPAKVPLMQTTAFVNVKPRLQTFHVDFKHSLGLDCNIFFLISFS